MIYNKRIFQKCAICGSVVLISGIVFSLLWYGILCFLQWKIVDIGQEGVGTRLILLGTFIIGTGIGSVVSAHILNYIEDMYEQKRNN